MEKPAISLPNKPWAVAFDSDGFQVTRNETQPDGREYLLAENHDTHVILSVFLEPVAKGAADCAQNQKERLQQKVDYRRENIEKKETNSGVIVAYTIPEVDGTLVMQRNVFSCSVHDDTFVDIHVSKAFFKPQDGSLLDAVINSAHVVPIKPRAPVVTSKNSAQLSPADARTSMDYFRQGSVYYLQQNYRAAIPPYQRALSLEKESPSLSRNLWRVLVDNLGMAYGITGDLDSAESTFQYGLSRDPNYPMFFYNLGCTAAERGDMQGTMDFLQKAFANKANSIPGEGMPDPRQDDSFQRFMSDSQFRQFVDNLMRQ